MGILQDFARRALRGLARHPAAPRLGRFLVRAHADGARERLRPGPVFEDSSGREHRLQLGLRDLLVPRWRGAVAAPEPPGPEEERERLRGTLNHGRVVVEPLLRALRGHGFELGGARVLELGCGEGAISCALAARGAAEVVGMEYVVYHENQAGEDAPGEAIRRRFQAMVAEGADFHAQEDLGERVRLVLDDIAAPSLEPGSFDLVISWNVLEHLMDPPAAMAGQARLLAPGGMSFHEYNPFFCATGGHSLCTLDIPWGHVRLAPGDVRAYLERFRPDEAEKAMAFYEGSLNRMSLRMVREASRGAGLEVRELVPWVEEDALEQVDGELLDQVQELYPTATAVDLAAPRVWLVQRRGDSRGER